MLWILPGALLILWGAIMPERIPDVIQYVFLPGAEEKTPAGSGAGKESNPWLQNLTETEKEWENAFPADSLHGTAEGVSLKTGIVTADQVTVTETLGEYFSVYPRAFTAGRPLARATRDSRSWCWIPRWHSKCSEKTRLLARSLRSGTPGSRWWGWQRPGTASESAAAARPGFRWALRALWTA